MTWLMVSEAPERSKQTSATVSPVWTASRISYDGSLGSASYSQPDRCCSRSSDKCRQSLHCLQTISLRSCDIVKGFDTVYQLLQHGHCLSNSLSIGRRFACWWSTVHWIKRIQMLLTSYPVSTRLGTSVKQSRLSWGRTSSLLAI